jgi:6-phosphofructokinase 1
MPEIKRIGIGLSGGAASGNNAVIRSVFTHARYFGIEAVAFKDAFYRLQTGLPDATEVLTESRVTGISNNAGSILGLSKPGVPKSDDDFRNIVAGLRREDIRHLIWIGGDDSSRILRRLIDTARAENFSLSVVLVPKTIDNDAWITDPENAFAEHTLGFNTAVLAGADAVHGLNADANMTDTWWLYVSMGRSAGHLPLAIYKRTEAESFLIGEELELNTPLPLVTDFLLATLLKKAAKSTHTQGVTVLGENIIEKIALEGHSMSSTDMGNPNLGEIPIGEILRHAVTRRAADLGFRIRVRAESMARGVRTAKPAPSDISLGTVLGIEAVRALRQGHSEVVVSVRNDQPYHFPFSHLIDPATGHIRTRRVAPSVIGHIRQRSLWRLHPAELDDQPLFEAMAAHAPLAGGPDALRRIFAPIAAQFGSEEFF